MTAPRFSDHVKARGIRLMRRSHLRTLESTSARTYRSRRVPTSPAPRLLPAARRYRGMGWLPTSLIAPEKLPAEAKLPNKYYLPYYATSKLGWMLYGRAQINPELEWSAELSWNEFFAGPQRGWGDPADDRLFTQLRLQGPNPFMLRKVDAIDPDRREREGDTIFSLDFGPLYDGAFEATEARFRLDDGELSPTSIRIGELVFFPPTGGDDAAVAADWDDAKRVVNALDAREAVFIRHLLMVHLMVGQAYSLAAYRLPTWHPLRGFMDFFTYGTLVVNDAAYKALLMPDSYFLRSNFVTAADARHIIENATAGFDFTQWVWPKDREARAIGEIDDHPYVAAADRLWPVFTSMVEGYLDDLAIDDGDVQTDPHLANWYEVLCEVLPGTESITKLTNRDELVELMTAVIWNNVIHEVCGNLSPLLDSRNPRDLIGVNLASLRRFVHSKGAAAKTDGQAPIAEPIPKAADVFLMDQATYVSRFNVAGNNLMSMPVARYVDDPRLRDAIIGLQRDLTRVQGEIETINAARDIPFLNIEPKKFEASISF
ncbi:MAG: lipoxygenase family protein [Actinomycetota bacterium]